MNSFLLVIQQDCRLCCSPLFASLVIGTPAKDILQKRRTTTLFSASIVSLEEKTTLSFPETISATSNKSPGSLLLQPFVILFTSLKNQVMPRKGCSGTPEI
jgi:hypothetical protein